MNPYQNLQPANQAGNAFLQAYEGGRERRRESETQNALTKYAINPDDPSAMEGLARFNPQMAIQLQERKRQEAMRGLETHRESILIGAKVFREAKRRSPGVPDEQIYASILPTLQQLRIDTSQLPAPGDPQIPQYLQSVMTLADALDPQSGDQGFTLGPGQARYGPDGQLVAKGPPRPPRYYPVQPGGKLVLDPSYGGEEGDDEWEYVLPQGGPTPQASGGFPPGGY
jgi:hypothetical protein